MRSHEPSLRDLDELPVERIPVSSLATGLSPRVAGEDPGHIRVLADVGVRLPPILVRRQTMQVIDGAHRLEAARLRGDTEIDARVVDEDEATSFLLAVRANIMHGMPLSLRDRRDAAKQILALYPRWSDRKVAEAAGLAPGTVAKLRHGSTGQDEQLNSIGRDGRIRPRDQARGRNAARRIMIDNPELSLRDVAQRAGVSTGTAWSVRARLKGDDKKRGGFPLSRVEELPGLSLLLDDPSFRSTDNGKLILRIFSSYSAIAEDGVELARAIPRHCAKSLANAARAYGQAWQEFADCIDLVSMEKQEENGS